jgi:DNA-directed RNA polymerase alpha subunit
MSKKNITISLSPRIINMISNLIETELYGVNESKVCENLVCRQLEQMLLNNSQINHDIQKPKPQIMKKHLIDCGFSARTNNMFETYYPKYSKECKSKRIHMQTVEHLVSTSKENIMKQRNFGRKGMLEIDKFMKKNNLYFGMLD